MEGLAVLILIVAGLAILDLSAMSWGTDSRDRIGDDRSRPTLWR